jgi:hypothetical protein
MFATVLSGQGAEAFGWIAALVAALAGVFLLLRLVFPSRWRKATRTPEIWILVDGSNVMHWVDNTATLEPVKRVVDHLKALGFVPGIVFDANAGWKLEGRYLHDGDFARLLKVEKRQVMVVPKGTQADPFLLETAREFGARIVTNDRFRDWAEAHPEVKQPGLLIRGGYRHDGTFWLAETPLVPTAATA